MPSTWWMHYLELIVKPHDVSLGRQFSKATDIATTVPVYYKIVDRGDAVCVFCKTDKRKAFSPVLVSIVTIVIVGAWIGLSVIARQSNRTSSSSIFSVMFSMPHVLLPLILAAIFLVWYALVFVSDRVLDMVNPSLAIIRSSNIIKIDGGKPEFSIDEVMSVKIIESFYTRPNTLNIVYFSGIAITALGHEYVVLVGSALDDQHRLTCSIVVDLIETYLTVGDKDSIAPSTPPSDSGDEAHPPSQPAGGPTRDP